MSKQLESVLRDSGLASDLQLRRVQERVEQGAGSFIEVLTKEERVPEEAVADAIAARVSGAAGAGGGVPPRRRGAAQGARADCPQAPVPAPRHRGTDAGGGDGGTHRLPGHPGHRVRCRRRRSSRWPLPCRRCWRASTSATAPRTRIGTFLANVPDAPTSRIVAEANAELSMDMADTVEAAEVARSSRCATSYLRRPEVETPATCTSNRRCTTCRCGCAWTACLRDYTRVPKWLHGPVRVAAEDPREARHRRAAPAAGRPRQRALSGRLHRLCASRPCHHYGEKMCCASSAACRRRASTVSVSRRSSRRNSSRPLSSRRA